MAETMEAMRARDKEAEEQWTVEGERERQNRGRSKATRSEQLKTIPYPGKYPESQRHTVSVDGYVARKSACTIRVGRTGML